MAASSGSGIFDLDTQSAPHDSFARPSNADSARDDNELLWAVVERLPSVKRLNAAVLRRTASELGRSESEGGIIETLDVRKLDRSQRELLVKNALATSEQDNFKLLSGIKQRLSRVGLELPKVEVRFQQLNITAKVQTGSRALPTLLNYTIDTLEGILTGLKLYRPKKQSLTILNNVDGCLKPGRMTLLLGPPGAGKSSLLLALSGKLDANLKQTGDITYNGHNLDEFCVKRTSAYIGQIDNHIAELTVRETVDFAARCQGASEAFAAYSDDLLRLEKEKNIRPSPEIDAFMKASSVKGKKMHISTDYILRVLGLNVCSETIVGSDMLRGVSGGQRKRVTTGEMIVGPRKTLLMDEISTGLDSSTTFQIVKCIGNFVHQMEGTVLMALLQPAPETFELFDDLILLSEGYMVYHGPRADVLEFFESLGFKLPPRKGAADFLQEVTSKKDQAQYWADSSKPYRFISVPEIAEAFKKSRFGTALQHELSTPFDKSKNHPTALAKSRFAVPKWDLFKGCLQRELMLVFRHKFLYLFRTFQVLFMGMIAATVFPKSELHPGDEADGQRYMACLFYALTHMLFNGISELSLTIFRLPVFYKQRENCFYPAWAWSYTSWLLRVPYSLLESVIWSIVVYYSVGFAPSSGRFFRYLLLLFLEHQMAVGLFRMLAVITRDITIANTISSCAMLLVFALGGYLIPKDQVKKWWIWGYWLSPLSYAQKALAVNEFTASRWNKRSLITANTTVGANILKQQSIINDKDWYWYGAGVLFLYGLLFNNIVTVALTYLDPAKASAVLAETDDSETSGDVTSSPEEGEQKSESAGGGSGGKKGMILPFQPLTMTFHNVNYFVDMPKAMKAQGVTESRLQLLSTVSGAFSPGVLTALVGASGAGKTTLMDVLAGRKTGGYIEGEIRVSGYPKVQSTFARVAAYVEQNDIHSPQVTVEESLWFSSVLRLPKDLSEATKREFVEQVMKLVELEPLRHAIVGLPGVSGLSTEQRKRLTIGVELVANPSIIFMDEPTSGLDARAAAIVMRTVRNTVDTGRTVVCTIHQPSIDIFEAFDELVLMKRGGRIIYGGKLGVHSQILIDYFQAINGIPPIPAGYNPATWMLEVTTPSIEEKIGEDFEDLYRNSNQFRDVETTIKRMSEPEAGAPDLHFDKPFAQDSFSQFKICLKKQFLVYWRSPEYNVVRILLTTLVALILGSVYWKAGAKRDNVTHLFTLMGALYSACLFLGVSNATSVQPIVSIERTVFYREKAAGMYSPLAYAAAQGAVEIPYVAVQTVIYSLITYLMMDFDKSFRKFFFYFIFMFLTFTYFTFYGMMSVGLTSSQHMAAVISSAFYSLWNLFSGFLVPVRHIPGWWIWFYYVCPVAWTLRGVITSQLSDVETLVTAPGFSGTVRQYIQHQFGYQADWLGITLLVLLLFNFVFFGIFMASVKYLNFQKR